MGLKGDLYAITLYYIDIINSFFFILWHSGLPLIREKSGKFKVREKSGNFVIGQGNSEI
jgi:hypothetical protein